MEIFYKYSKFRSIKELMSCTVRLSPPHTLNDPFESFLNKDVSDELINYLNSIHSVGNQASEDAMIQKACNMIRVSGGLLDYAVFSLSETPRNLLMWAHYADEHKGICIGYKRGLFESLPNKPETRFGIESYTPIKVNYDNLRPQPIEEGSEDIDAIIKKQNITQLTTKSDDWIYEKEHRCIIPMCWSDAVKIPEQYNIQDNTVPSTVLSLLKKEKRIIEDNNEKNLYTCEHHEMRGLSIIFGDKRNVIFLKKIDPKDIVSINFGCRFDIKTRDIIASQISNPSHPLHHVKLIQFSISENRFELIPKKITHE
ncbi:TPA: DUF2971 domain-containing protein [Aeromonas dhakensis]|nr:DUF2971 domain-containing protein [Aeromonas dhakensis]